MPKREAPGSAPVKAETKKTDEVKSTGKKVVEKFPLTEKAKKFIEKVEKGLTSKIFETREVEAGKTGTAKHRVVFITFSETPKSDTHPELTEEDDQFNVETIKKILFYYHTAKDAPDQGLELLQVIAPDEEEGFHLFAYQEFSEK